MKTEIDNAKLLHEVELVDVVEMSKNHPTTFILPSYDRIIKLKKGATVKLGFITEDEKVATERMWVIIKMIREDGSFIGALDNDPFILKHLVFEDYVKFEAKNILDIYPGC